MPTDRQTAWPASTPAVHVRVARPTDKLDEVVAFYRDGLGLPELGRFGPHDGYVVVMLGLPDAGHHLEFTTHEDGSPGAAPTRDNLIVLYFSSEQERDEVAERLTALGHPTVEPENPFWVANGGIEIEDPDGWGVILMPEPWQQA